MDYVEMLARELWFEMWPEIMWGEASEEDQKLLLDHAHSLYIYDGS